MMVKLNVTQKTVDSTKEIIKGNIAWKSSSSVNDIREWLENHFNPSSTESTTTTVSSTTTSSTNGQTSSSSTTEQVFLPGSGTSLKTFRLLILTLNIFSLVFYKIL